MILLVADLEATQQDYADLFGFHIQPYPGSTHTLMVESADIHFFLQQSNVESEVMCQQHLSLHVDDTYTVIQLLQTRQISYEEGIFSGFWFNNYRWVEWHDWNVLRSPHRPMPLNTDNYQLRTVYDHYLP